MTIKNAPSLWRIERNRKMHFCVVRDTEDGREYVTSASGRVSSFKTLAGAKRALREKAADAPATFVVRQASEPTTEQWLAALGPCGK